MSENTPQPITPSPRTHKDYTVGWVCALPLERTAAVAMLDFQHPRLEIPAADRNAYTLGSIGEHNIVIACLPKGMIGNNNAAAVATQMVMTFTNVKFGFMVGIGGGIPPAVRLGDVVVGTPGDGYPGVVQWDMGKAVQGGGFQRTGALDNPPRSLLAALTELETAYDLNSGSKIPQYLAELEAKQPNLAKKFLRNESMKDIAFKATASHLSKSDVISQTLIGEDVDDDEEEDEEEEEDQIDDCRYCDKTKIFRENNRDMRVHFGLIASGNQVIKDAAFRTKINKELCKKVLCFEMEAAGLINVFPCLVIRGICDYADSHKNKIWQPHAAIVAAAFTKELLGYVQGVDVKLENSAMDLISGIGDQIYEARADIKLIHSNMDKEENRQIISWLTGTDYESIHADYRKKRMSGTGEWITDSTEFLEWLRGDKQTLFCTGRPGAGKTIITTIVIDWLQEVMPHEDNGDIGIAHIYFNYKRHGGETVETIIANLLGQLSRRLSSMPSSVRDLYERDAKGQNPKIEQYLEALSSVAALYSKVLILVDALDECHLGERRRFLTQIFNFQTKSGANLFMTSRDIPDINEYFGESLKLEISGREEDLQKYMEGSLPDLPRILSQKPELWEQIQRKTLKAADGIFLLVALRFEYLRNLVTENEILEVLKKGPGTGSDSVYHEAYDQIMTRIQGQHKHSFSRARGLLSWLTGSKQQLTTQELRHAPAVQVGQSQFDEKDIPDLGRVVSFCCGLVAFDEDSDIIRLVHYTAQDYLMENQSEWLPNMETEIAESCVTYLSYEVFRTGARNAGGTFHERLRSNPLYEYASANWGYHVNAAAIGGKSLVMGFLESEGAVSASVQCLFYSKMYISPPISPGWIWIHLCAFFGIQEPLTAVDLAVVRANMEIISTVGGRTPLSWAVEKGHEAVARLLINAGAEIETKDGRDLTPLLRAAKKGHQAVVRLLIEAGAETETEDSKGLTPLSWAAENGDKTTVELLLAAKAEIETKDGRGLTPLLRAAKKGHQAVVRLLIEAGAEIETKSMDDRTPLSWAAEAGHEAVVRLLLDAGANVKTTDKYGLTPLSWAAEEEHGSVAKLLLDAGAPKVDTYDPNQFFDPAGERAVAAKDIQIEKLRYDLQSIKYKKFQYPPEGSFRSLTLERRELWERSLLPGQQKLTGEGTLQAVLSKKDLEIERLRDKRERIKPPGYETRLRIWQQRQEQQAVMMY
ncbi:hypothetical protein AOL_s00117g39 [Orbilia oligospora ATCC 24927]|uniref:Uncharacterized protein n=1 Tax=Arthrobotrys oligospora (strain ATCC 24927 / CBS 115.81 / DSM 1491) TaxID=756982 RepID=G1XLZ2_ARTOA|nr:hypothetical protein AOL_s00117g39 [Orbilia oligospora ATCC 24927]EGX45834.1 hypothetical protein AOL_s00117g39 [Orbilia oligospora ATCC 24927]